MVMDVMDDRLFGNGRTHRFRQSGESLEHKEGDDGDQKDDEV